MTLRKKIRYRIEYGLFACLILIFRILPIGWIPIEARILRGIFKLIGSRYSRVVSKNLLIAFPRLSPRERDRLKKEVYRFFSRMMVWNLNLFAKRNIERLLPPVKIDHPEILKNFAGKGVILITAHFGNWELLPFILKESLGLPIHSIARSMDNPYIEEKVSAFRKYMGSRVIYKNKALRRILKVLDDHQPIGFLIDQNVIPKEAIKAVFFDQEIHATPILARIHIKKKNPVIPIFLCHEGDHLRVDIHPPVPVTTPGGAPKSVKQLTQEYLTIIEKKIKEYPSQWFWFHNRWKNLGRDIR